MSELDTTVSVDDRLRTIRGEIDIIDEQIIALWAERNRLAAEAGVRKRAAGGTVYSHARDNEVRERFVELAENNGISRDLGRSAIGTLMAASYEAQRSIVST